MLVDSITVYRLVGLSLAVARGSRRHGGGRSTRRHQGSQERKFLDTRIRHAASPPSAQVPHAVPVILAAFSRTLVPGIRRSPGSQVAVLAAVLSAIPLPAETGDADLKGPQAPRASQVQELELVHPPAAAEELDGGRELGDLPSARPSAHGGPGGKTRSPTSFRSRARASTPRALSPRLSCRSDLDRQIDADSGCRRQACPTGTRRTTGSAPRRTWSPSGGTSRWATARR